MAAEGIGHVTGPGIDYHQIEPKIEPLVRAVLEAGFVTFSSCEGHKDYGEDSPRFACVAFFANEQQARVVHGSLFELSKRLVCSWVLRGCFVRDRAITGEWALGWVLENRGIFEDTDTYEEFVDKSVDSGWNTDIPALVEMFRKHKMSAGKPLSQCP